MSRLDCVHAFRRIPPKRRFRARFTVFRPNAAAAAHIPAEGSCLQNACSWAPREYLGMRVRDDVGEEALQLGEDRLLLAK